MNNPYIVVLYINGRIITVLYTMYSSYTSQACTGKRNGFCQVTYQWGDWVDIDGEGVEGVN